MGVFDADGLSAQQTSFKESRERYVRFFLAYAKHAISSVKEEIEAEILNLQHAFNVALAVNNQLLIREFWEVTSDFYWSHGYWQFYFDWGENTLKVLREFNYPIPKAWLISELGWLRMEWGEYEIADEMIQEAKQIFYEEDDQRGICVIERYLGVLAYRRGDFDTASLHYTIAEKIAYDNGYELGLSEIFNLQGGLARKQGDINKARELYEESRRLAEKAGDNWRVIATLRNIAKLEFEVGNLDRAKEGLTRTMELCQEQDRKDMLYSCQLGLARIELKLGNVDRARNLALSARDGYVFLGIRHDIETVDDFLASLPQIEENR